MTGSDDHEHDAAWYATLTGAATDDPEAQSLRAAVKKQYAADLDALGGTDELALQRLLKRCADEGLLKPKRPGPLLMSLLAVAASVLLTVNLLLEPMHKTPTPGDDIVYRGLNEAGVAILSVAAPRQAANALRDELEQAGVSALVSQTGDTWQLQADLALPVADAAQTILKRHALPVPADGRLRVRFETAAGP